MGISTILGFVSLLGWLMVIGGAIIGFANAAQNRSARPGLLLAAVGLVVGIFFGVAGLGLVEIGATEVGVVFQLIGGNNANGNGSLWDTPLGPGVHIIVPIINQVTVYSTRSQTYTMAKSTNEGNVTGDDSVEARTKDGQQTFIDVSVAYNVDPAKVNMLHLKWQDNYNDAFVRVRVRAAVYSIIANYGVDDVYSGKRVEIQDNLIKSLQPEFEDNGLALTSLVVRNITFSPEFAKSVEDKQIAQQQAEQAIQEATRKRTLAQGDADSAAIAADGESKAEVARAQGDAEAIKLRAAADAQGLALINEQISKNPQLIEWRYIDKLAGNVQLVLIPNNSPFLFNPSDLINKTGASAGSANATATPSNTATPQPTATPSS